jgi:16S rRNA (guanine966-N2)-methyltransferase
VEARLQLDGVAVLDLFAGSGALALEALSRGAESAVIVEQNRRCCATIEANARTLGFASQCTIVGKSVASALPLLSDGELQFELVLLDPPYAVDPWPTLQALVEHRLLGCQALALAEHASRLDGPPQLRDLDLELSRRYGDTALTLYRHTGQTAAPRAVLVD